ncbi:MAG: hypothetical protein E6Q97_35775 [Desulfurellales bacterium]|nr:MAG: hypothetical protein E6Q97_35775 [Desulfurellales bacterium]
MKPRKVILTIETTTDHSLETLRNLRGAILRGVAQCATCDVEVELVVDQISVNVVREPKGTKR